MKTLLSNTWARISKNPKTTLPGIASFGLFYLLYSGRITEQQAMAVITLAAAFGLTLSKDPKKSN